MLVYDFSVVSTLTVTEASRNFSDLINRVVYRGDVAILTRNGKAVVRIVPETQRPATGVELAAFWRSRETLSPEEADAFDADLREIRREGNRQTPDRWSE